MRKKKLAQDIAKKEFVVNNIIWEIGMCQKRTPRWDGRRLLRGGIVKRCERRKAMERKAAYCMSQCSCAIFHCWFYRTFQLPSTSLPTKFPCNAFFVLQFSIFNFNYFVFKPLTYDFFHNYVWWNYFIVNNLLKNKIYDTYPVLTIDNKKVTRNLYTKRSKQQLNPSNSVKDFHRESDTILCSKGWNKILNVWMVLIYVIQKLLF